MEEKAINEWPFQSSHLNGGKSLGLVASSQRLPSQQTTWPIEKVNPSKTVSEFYKPQDDVPHKASSTSTVSTFSYLLAY